MTTERAIELLNRISDSQFDGIHGDERREALEMAVRALSGDGDTIYRKAAIEFIDYLLSQPCKGHTGDFVEGMRDGYYRMRSAIKYLPSAQPQRKKGKWICGNDFHWYTASCNKCGYTRKTDIKATRWNEWKFCPSCGAEMRGESDETD